MLAYGVRVMDEKRKLWRAAEILNDVWNDAQYARALAETAIQKYNRDMEECNRVIEAQLSGRASPTALEATDARNELTRLRGELDAVDSDRKVLKAKLTTRNGSLTNSLFVWTLSRRRERPAVRASRGTGVEHQGETKRRASSSHGSTNSRNSSKRRNKRTAH